MAEKVIIASGKGGVGKTSLTAGLAMALAAKGESVLIIDCDIGQGCVELMLGARDVSVYNWGDAIKAFCSNKEVLNVMGAVAFVCAPQKWDDAFTPEAFKAFVSSFEEFSYILFDSPAGVLGGFCLAAACADRGLIISTPDAVCVKAAASAANELLELGVESLRLVINRFDKESTKKGVFLNIDEVIDAVSVQLIGVVPEDKNITYSTSTGFAQLKDCAAKASFGRIADRLRGKRVELVLKKTKKENPPTKKPLVAALCAICAVLIVLAGVFFTDFYMCQNLKEPIFTKQISYGSQSSVYRGFCYTIELERVVINGEESIISTSMTAFGKTVSAAIT